MTERRFDPDPPDPEGDAERAAKRRDALEAAKDAARRGEWEHVLREAEGARTPDPVAEAADLAQRIDEAPDLEALASLAPDPDPLRPLRSFEGKPRPRRVLWMDPNKGGGTVLRVGDVAALGGAGGVGKSFASLALAVKASGPGNGPAHAIGFEVRRGGTVLISFEDDPETVAWRAGLIAGQPLPDRLHVLPDPEPLMTADPDRPGEARESPAWPGLFTAIRARSPSLVIVDPVSAALAGVNQSDGGTVRRFIRALGREGTAGGWGTLIVAHSTKGARIGKTGPGRLEAMREQGGALAGSGQWWDACRGVLAMASNGKGHALIQCQKSNHGPPGWVIALEADTRTRERTGKPDLFAGWKRRRRYSPEAWAAETGQHADQNSGQRRNGGAMTPEQLRTFS